MNFLAKFLGLLPNVLATVEKTGTDLSGDQKKQAATDILTGIAGGVAVAAPQFAVPAAAAAQLAVASIDGFVALFNEIGVFTHKSSAPAAAAPVAAAPIATPVAAAAPVAAPAVAPLVSGPSTPSTDAPLVTGPGLHNVVAA